MKYLFITLALLIAACAPDHPDRDGAAGALARAGYFGPIEERYDADILAAHPDVRQFVRSISCRTRDDGAALCAVDFAGASKRHEILFCRCGGGGVHEWSIMTDLDDPLIPKIQRPTLNEQDFLATLQMHRDRALKYERETTYQGDARGALYFRRLDALQEIKSFYRRLDAKERAIATRELSGWLFEPDPLLRDQTIQLIDELCVRGAEGAIDRLLASLRETSAQSSEIEKAEHARKRASDPNCLSH